MHCAREGVLPSLLHMYQLYKQEGGTFKYYEFGGTTNALFIYYYFFRPPGRKVLPTRFRTLHVRIDVFIVKRQSQQPRRAVLVVIGLLTCTNHFVLKG